MKVVYGHSSIKAEAERGRDEREGEREREGGGSIRWKISIFLAVIRTEMHIHTVAGMQCRTEPSW